MYNLEVFVVAVYCLMVNDLYPSFCRTHGKPRRAGFPPTLTDEECLTVEIVGQFLGYHNQKQLYERMHERFGSWFPGLKDRAAFVRQSANLWQVKACLQQDIVYRLGGHRAPYQIIDTVPIPICKTARRFRRKIFRADPVSEFPHPTKGYCAAKEEAYFGFKGGLRMTDYGLIVQTPLLQAYGHDSRSRDPLLAGVTPDTSILGDAAFLDLDWQLHCQEHYQVRVLTPIKSNIEAARAAPDQVVVTASADVSKRGQSVVGQAGPLDFLITSAGMAHPGYFDDLPVEIFEHSMAVNYFGTLYAIKSVLPAMLERKRGHLVLISSGAGLIGLFGYTPYGPTKFALRGLAESLRGELKGTGVHISIVYPPDTDTPQLEAENKTKPLETKMITGSAKMWRAEGVADVIVRGIKKQAFVITPGMEMAFLARLHSVLAPAINWYFDRLAAKARQQVEAGDGD